MDSRGDRPGGPAAPRGRPDDDEPRRLSLFYLCCLSAAGVIGSGWLLSIPLQKAGQQGNGWAWLLGGLAMILISFAMVELGADRRQTGALILIPLEGSGPLVALVVAAALWLVYLINMVSEAVAMVILTCGRLPGEAQLPIAVAAMALIAAVSALPVLCFLRLNAALTGFKLLVLLVVVACLPHLGGHVSFSLPRLAPVANGLHSLVSAGVIYAYVGFQAPLDFAGNVKKKDSLWRGRVIINEKNRIRLAVYTTIVMTWALYLGLYTVYHHAAARSVTGPDAALLRHIIHQEWLGILVRVAYVVSPIGAGLVYARVLTFEIAALARTHLTHRGLQSAALTVNDPPKNDFYWPIIVLNGVLGLLMFAGFYAVGNFYHRPWQTQMEWVWETLSHFSGVLNLVVFAFPGLALMVLPRKDGGGRRGRLAVAMAALGFAVFGMILAAAGMNTWLSVAALVGGFALLLALPLLARHLPWFWRVYDAREPLLSYREVKTSRAARAAWRAALVFLGFLTLLAGSGVLVEKKWVTVSRDHFPLAVAVIFFVSLVVFYGFAAVSKEYKAQPPVSNEEPAADPAWTERDPMFQGRSGPDLVAEHVTRRAVSWRERRRRARAAARTLAWRMTDGAEQGYFAEYLQQMRARRDHFAIRVACKELAGPASGASVTGRGQVVAKAAEMLSASADPRLQKEAFQLAERFLENELSVRKNSRDVEIIADARIKDKRRLMRGTVGRWSDYVDRDNAAGWLDRRHRDLARAVRRSVI